MTLAALSTLLAGCDNKTASQAPASPSAGGSQATSIKGNSDTAKPSTPSAKPSTPSTPSAKPSDSKPSSTVPAPELPTELVDADLENADTNDITYEADVTLTESLSMQGTSIDMVSLNKVSDIKLGDGLYKEDATLKIRQINTSTFNYDTSTETGLVGYWRSANGYINYNEAPDLHNQTETQTINQPFALLENPVFGNLSEDYFEYDADASLNQAYSVFNVSDSYLTNATARAHLDDLTEFYANVGSLGLETILSSVSSMGGSVSSSTVITMESFSVKIDLDGLVGFDYAYNYDLDVTSSGSSGTLTFTLVGSVNLKDVESTNLQLSDVQHVPFVPTANASTQYAAFNTAIQTMAQGKYAFAADVTERRVKTNGYKGVVLGDEFSTVRFAYDTLGTEDYSNAIYAGVHKVGTGVYDSYASYSSSISGGSAHADANSIPTFDFVAEIFEYDAAASTADKYVFTLRDEIDDLEVVDQMSVFSFNNADNLSVTVTKDGVFEGFSFNVTGSSSFNTSLASTYTVDFTFSGVGTTTSIPAEIATFGPDYVAYVTPTTYEELDVVVDYDASNSSGTNQYYDGTSADALTAIFGDATYKTLPNVLNYGNLGDYYYASLYSASQKFIEIHFEFDTEDELAAALQALVTGLVNDNYQMGYNQSYGYYIYQSGNVAMLIGVSTDSGYTLFVAYEYYTPSTNA